MPDLGLARSVRPCPTTTPPLRYGAVPLPDKRGGTISLSSSPLVGEGDRTNETSPDVE